MLDQYHSLCYVTTRIEFHVNRTKIEQVSRMTNHEVVAVAISRRQT